MAFGRPDPVALWGSSPPSDTAHPDSSKRLDSGCPAPAAPVGGLSGHGLDILRNFRLKIDGDRIEVAVQPVYELSTMHVRADITRTSGRTSRDPNGSSMVTHSGVGEQATQDDPIGTPQAICWTFTGHRIKITRGVRTVRPMADIPSR